MDSHGPSLLPIISCVELRKKYSQQVSAMLSHSKISKERLKQFNLTARKETSCKNPEHNMNIPTGKL